MGDKNQCEWICLNDEQTIISRGKFYCFYPQQLSLFPSEKELSCGNIVGSPLIFLYRRFMYLFKCVAARISQHDLGGSWWCVLQQIPRAPGKVSLSLSPLLPFCSASPSQLQLASRSFLSRWKQVDKRERDGRRGGKKEEQRKY